MYSLINKTTVEKPWGRTDIPAALKGRHCSNGDRLGEIHFDAVLRDVLVKFLLTSDRLSIQVHPDDIRASELGFERGKDELWLVLEANPGAKFGIGLTQYLSSEELRRVCISGEVADMVDWQDVRRGDYVYNPAGTIHALGSDLVILEVQQNSDITFRLHDFGRGRSVQINEAVSSARHTSALPAIRHTDFSTSEILVDGPKFGLAYWKNCAPDLPRWSSEFQIITWDKPLSLGSFEIPPASSALVSRQDLRKVPSTSEFFIVWSAATGA